MVTARWKIFGASVRGPGHVREYLPNQDSFRVASHIWGDVAVVSDGVGSCSTSEYGSAAVCLAVVCTAENWHDMNDNIDALVEQIQKNWLVQIQPFEPKDCAATCLFVIRPVEGRIILGMLGDGLVAVLKTDGTYMELYEDKDGSFSNQTDALSERTQIEQWRTASIVQEECCAILLCTDGVADDLLPEKRGDFVHHIYTQGQKFATGTVTHELRKMLENWPVPKHSDDKTLVCLYQCQEEA